VRGTWLAQNVSVQALASWIPKATWSNQPSVTGAAVTTSLMDLDDGDLAELDVTALVQAIVTGQANYGWRITTSSSAVNTVYGFDSGRESWSLEIEYVDEPTAPAQLAPQGLMSIAKWQIQIDDQDDLAQIKVQVSATADPGSTWDSGWVAVTAPVLDLATTSYPGLADAATTYWRAAVKTVDGSVSDWSEWVEVSRAVKPTLVVDTPSLGTGTSVTVTTSTPDVAAHLVGPAGTASTRWRVRVLSVAAPGSGFGSVPRPSKVLWDSGTAIQGATLSVQVPRRSDGMLGKAILEEDGDYVLEVSVLDRPDRVSSYGDPAWTKTLIPFTVDSDNSQAVPEALVVSQPSPGSPDVLLHWTRAGSAPDEFVIERDGKILPWTADAAGEAMVDANTWEWIDVTAAPAREHVYRVRAVTGNSQSAWSVAYPSIDDPPFVLTTTGVWLRSWAGSVKLGGKGVDQIQHTDKRTTYQLPYNSEDVDIIGAVSGYSGTFSGTVYDEPDQGLFDALEVLEAIRQHPERSVQLVWGTQSVPVFLRGLSYAPSPDIQAGTLLHTVGFEFFQTKHVGKFGFGASYYDSGAFD
jgi:hypothetical protein